MSDLIGGMQQAADVLADASIDAFWRQYDLRMNAAVRQAHQRIPPEVRLRGLVSQVFLESVNAGWIDPNTYAYTAFVSCDLLSEDAILEHLAEQIEAHGILTTQDLQFANELWRQLRQLKRQPPQRKGFFGWLTG